LTDNHDEQEWTVSLAAGCALENVALVIKDGVLSPIYNFIHQKMFTSNWADRYISLLAFGSVI
jgi:hypothetical protein